MSTSESLGQNERGYHHGDLRHALIEAGVALLAEQSAAGIDLRAVARRAGVSRTAPYRHFASKQELLVAIAEVGFQALEETLRAASGDADLETRLLALMRAYVQFGLTRPAHLREMFSGISIDRAAHPLLYDAAKRCFSIIVNLCLAAQAVGIVRNEEATRQAMVIWSTAHGLAMLLIERQLPGMLDDAAATEALIVQATSTLWHGMLK
jgi:AcrR family transcriptional regulator